MKELKISIPLEKGYGTTTKKIDGELDCIIINTNGRADIIIESELGYTIYKSIDAITGVNYIPIRVQVQDPNGHRINRSDAKFKLNEKIVIKIRQYQYVRHLFKSEEKQEVKLIIRYD